jgi:predicted permease
MDQTIQIINRVLPILFLIFLGYWIRRHEFLRESTIDELRKVVVNLALPAPFIVPLYIRPNLAVAEKQYINNVLTVHTVVSIAIYIVYFVINPPG